MHIMLRVVIRLLSTLFISLLLTPLVKIFAVKIGAVVQPGPRRINDKAMPLLGGVAIFLAFSFSTIFLFPDFIPRNQLFPILFGGLIIIVTGMLDDLYELSPRQKSFGIILAAIEIYFLADIHFKSLTLPFIGFINLNWLSFPLTILWILAITNAVNLIDGLDGLAAGVSIIALTTIGIVGYFFLTEITVPIIIFILIAAIMGFFPYNFYPAKIYLGDTGALFLGFMLSVLSLQGLKNATLISLGIPMLIIGVPITDTVYAIIRRVLNKKPISSADKMHLHHRLMSLGFSHQGAVLAIYAMALIFSFIALFMSYHPSVFSTILLLVALFIGLELFVELIGLMGPNHQPLMCLFKFLGNPNIRETQKQKIFGKKNKKSEKE